MDYNMKIYEYEKAIRILHEKSVLLIDVCNNLNRLLPSINSTISINNIAYNQKEILDIIHELSEEYTMIRNVILPRMEMDFKAFIQAVNRGEINGN